MHTGLKILSVADIVKVTAVNCCFERHDPHKVTGVAMRTWAIWSHNIQKVSKKQHHSFA